jgi:hypothetical protein
MYTIFRAIRKPCDRRWSALQYASVYGVLNCHDDRQQGGKMFQISSTRWDNDISKDLRNLIYFERSLSENDASVQLILTK